jgi:hypothetical protein
MRIGLFYRCLGDGETLGAFQVEVVAGDTAENLKELDRAFEEFRRDLGQILEAKLPLKLAEISQLMPKNKDLLPPG